MSRPYALLRAGFPYYMTLGMRRVTNQPVDVAWDSQGRIFVLCRSDGGSQIARINWEDENLNAIGGSGRDDGKFVWPVSMIMDKDENLFISDEALHRIMVMDTEGGFVNKWGEQGSGDGQLNGPSGMAFDADENMYVVDTLNHRVQKFTKDGKFILKWGNIGTGEGEFNMPWGVAVDDMGDVCVTDWRNDRVQKFTADGEFICQFGTSGSDNGEFKRPAGIEVDKDGDIYVADCGNNRVQQFDSDGRYLQQFIGHATLSVSARAYLINNARPLRLREMSSLEPQQRLRSPRAIRIDEEGRMFVPDYGSFRVQIYKKDAIPLSEAQISPPLRSPSLFTA